MIGASANFDQQFDEAVAWFARRCPLLQGDWRQLQDRAQRRAFTVAGLAQLELVRDVQTSIEAALASGVPFGEWRDEIGPRLREAWAASGTNGGGHRLRVIWRNNVQLAYSAGRYHQMTDPDVLAARPYWLYDAVLDSGTTDVCRGLHGTLLPATSLFWKTHYPPLHHQCRSGVRTLTEEQARAKGISAEPDAAVPDGWGLPPGESEYVGDPNRFDPAMWGAHLGKLEGRRARVDREAEEARPPTGAEVRARLEEVARDLAPRETELERGRDEAFAALRAWETENAHLLAGSRADRERYLRDRDEHALRSTRALKAYNDFRQDRAKILRENLTSDTTSGVTLKVEGRPGKDAEVWREGFDFWRRLVGPRPALDGLTVVMRLGKNPRSYYNPADHTVYMGRGRPVSIVTHELAHWLEHHDPGVLRSEVEFYARRTAGESLQELRDLTGLNYRRGELAKRDRFLDAYMGKWYASGGQQTATELASMGIELLFDDALALARQDPDFFDWLWGMLRGV